MVGIVTILLGSSCIPNSPVNMLADKVTTLAGSAMGTEKMIGKLQAAWVFLNCKGLYLKHIKPKINRLWQIP